MKFEENWPRGYREVVQRCGQMDNRWTIIIAHPEPCSDELKTNQREVTQKLRKGEQSFLYVTHGFNLIHIALKFHQDILYS